MRLGAYGLTLNMVVLIPISYWMNPFVYLIAQTESSTHSFYLSLDPCDGVWMSSWGTNTVTNQGVPPVRGLYFLNKNEAVPSAWYALPHVQAGYLELPLIYPLLAGLAISARLFFVSRRMRRGPCDCGRCGYSLEGIDGGVCPECGVERV
jgi:hypothetical protein